MRKILQLTLGSDIAASGIWEFRGCMLSGKCLLSNKEPIATPAFAIVSVFPNVLRAKRKIEQVFCRQGSTDHL